MTPKEKAQELVDKFLNLEYGIIDEYLPKPKEVAKQCALICVENELNSIKTLRDEFVNKFFIKSAPRLEQKIHELQQVKTEIEKL